MQTDATYRAPDSIQFGFSLQLESMNLKDARIKKMNEVLNGIKVRITHLTDSLFIVIFVKIFSFSFIIVIYFSVFPEMTYL